MILIVMSLFAITANLCGDMPVADAALPKTPISLDARNESLKLALLGAFRSANLTCRFDAPAERLASQLSRTLHVHDLPLDTVTRSLLRSYYADLPVLSVREESGVYLFGLPHVNIQLQNEPATSAIAQLMGHSGLDWCVDMTGISNSRISYYCYREPFDKALSGLMVAINPKSAVAIDFVGGVCVPTRSDVQHPRIVPLETPICCYLHAAPFSDALAAVCDCVRQDYLLQVTGWVDARISLKAAQYSLNYVLGKTVDALAHATVDYDEFGTARIFTVGPGTLGPR